MWHLSNISLENFISHKNTKYSIDNNKAYLIVGENLDDDGQEGNGSGKSAIIESIIFVLTGDSFRKVKANELIKNDESECIVTLELYNTMLNSKMKIIRGLKQRGSSYVKIEYNEEQKVLSTVSEYDKFIIEQLDIPKEDLLNYFIISAEKYQSFLLSGDTKKKEIISRFSNINLLDKTFAKIDSEISEIKNKTNAITNEINKNLGKIELLSEQTQETLSEIDFYKQIEEQISNLIVKIDGLNNDIKQHDETITLEKQSLKNADNELINSNKLLDNFKSSQFDLQKSLTEIDLITKEVKMLSLSNSKEQSEIQKLLLDVVECPKCEHKFSYKNENLNIEELNLKLNNLKIEEQKINEELKVIDESRNIWNTKLNELNVNIRSVNSNIQQIEGQKLNFNRRIKTLENDLLIIHDRQKTYNNQINDLKSEEYTQPVANNTQKIEEINLLISQLQESLNIFEIDLINKNEWVNIFNKFKTHLANKSIKGIQSKINLYLEKIKSNLSVNIEGYKLLSDNRTIRENIVINVLRDGLDEGSFGKFSGGEKVRIDICCILALQSLINQNSKNGGLNLLILDEVIEKVDSLGVSEILKQLNELNQTILAITHSNQQRNFENVIKIIKKNKESKIM